MALGDIVTAPIQNTRTDFGLDGMGFADIANVSPNIQVIAFWGGVVNNWARARSINVNLNTGAFALPDWATIVAPPVSVDGFSIVHVAGDVFASTYVNAVNNRGYITTFSVTAAGGVADIADFQFSLAVASATMRILSVGRNRFAIFYQEQGTNDGEVQTVSISDDGVTMANVANLTFDAVEAQHIDACAVTGNIYAVAYDRPTVSQNYVRTLNISADGLTIALVDVVGPICTAPAWSIYSSICHIINSIYGVAHTGPGQDGFLSTLSISDAGVITLLTSPGAGGLEFDVNRCVSNAIVHVGLDMVAVFYEGAGAAGMVVTCSVGMDGLTPAIYDGPNNWLVAFCFDNRVVRVPNTNFYILTYRTAANDGWTASFEIDSLYPPLVQTVPATEVT